MVINALVIQHLTSDAPLSLFHNKHLCKRECFYILFLQKLADFMIGVNYHRRVRDFEPDCHELQAEQVGKLREQFFKQLLSHQIH